MFSHFERKHFVLEGVSLAALLAMFIFFAISWRGIGEMVPLYFSQATEIDNWGSQIAIMTLPVLALAMYLAMSFIELYPKFWNIPAQEQVAGQKLLSRSLSMLIVLKLVMVLVFFIIFYWTLHGANMPIVFIWVMFALLLAGIIIPTISISNYRRNVKAAQKQAVE